MAESRVAGWMDPGFGGGQDPPALLERLRALEPRTWLRRTPGRETFLWPGEPELVVKRFAGAGEPRDWWHERRSGRTRSPARREAENLAGLRSAGVAAPRPLAWVADASAARHPRLGGRRGTSALVMERVRWEQDLAAAAERVDGPELRRLADGLARLVARMHAAGWYHRDLYLHHVVVRTGELLLLDVGRARHQARPRERWLVKDLAALASTVPDGVPRGIRLAFLARWRREVRHARPGRALLAAVERKRERLLAHRPRFVEPGGRLDTAHSEV